MSFENTSTRRRFVAGAGSMAAAGLIGGQSVSIASAQDAATPVRGGDLTVMWTSDYVSMDPIHSNGTTRAPIYDWLFAWRADDQGVFSIQPMLATEWEAVGNTITVKIREGVTFHDGSALDAEVVAWNLTRMVQTPESFAVNALAAVDPANPAQVIDPMTVQINLSRPSNAVMTALSDVTLETAIVSKKAIDDNGPDYLKNNPVGTGPYKFVSWTTGDSLKTTRNETYWQMGVDGQPLPYIDNIEHRIIISVATQFAEMRAGTADFMRNVPGRDVPAAKETSDANYYETPLLGLRRQYFFNALKPPFQDNLAFRQAFQHAVDRESIAKALGSELGSVLPYEFVPGTIGYDATVPFYEFDLDKARAKMTESGLETPVEVRLTVHSRDLDQQQAQIIQAMVAEIGINITLDVVEDVAWGEQVRINNDFEVATRQSGTQADPTNSLLTTWAVGGNSAYSRATVPNLLETIQAADTTYVMEERQQLFVDAQMLMHESAWFGYMWFEAGNLLLHKRVQGLPMANGAPVVWGSLREWEWWISE